MAPLKPLLRPRALRWLACAAAAWAGLVFAAAAGAQSISREREVHAVFLLNLTRFVRWPEMVFPTENAPLVIGVLADDPIGPVLDDAAREETAGKHPIEIRRIRQADDLAGCHVVYFAKAQMAEAVQLIPLLRSKAVLTVSDGEGFLPLGGHVQMYNRGGQVKLRLNVDNLRRAELTASAQLLRVAETVGTGGPQRSGLRALPLQQSLVDRDGAVSFPRVIADKSRHPPATRFRRSQTAAGAV